MMFLLLIVTAIHIVASDDVPIAKIIDSSGPAMSPDSGPDKAIDGNPGTFWNVDIPGLNYNKWYITFELAERYTVFGANLYNYGDHTHDVSRFMLESSDDNTTWHMGGSVSDVPTGISDWQSFYGFTATGKYLRFTITQTYSGYQPWLKEISFTGYPGMACYHCDSYNTSSTYDPSCADDGYNGIHYETTFAQSCYTQVFKNGAVVRFGSASPVEDDCNVTDEFTSCHCSQSLCNSHLCQHCQ